MKLTQDASLNFTRFWNSIVHEKYRHGMVLNVNAAMAERTRRKKSFSYGIVLQYILWKFIPTKSRKFLDAKKGKFASVQKCVETFINGKSKSSHSISRRKTIKVSQLYFIQKRDRRAVERKFPLSCQIII